MKNAARLSASIVCALAITQGSRPVRANGNGPDDGVFTPEVFVYETVAAVPGFAAAALGVADAGLVVLDTVATLNDRPLPPVYSWIELGLAGGGTVGVGALLALGAYKRELFTGADLRVGAAALVACSGALALHGAYGVFHPPPPPSRFELEERARRDQEERERAPGHRGARAPRDPDHDERESPPPSTLNWQLTPTVYVAQNQGPQLLMPGAVLLGRF